VVGRSTRSLERMKKRWYATVAVAATAAILPASANIGVPMVALFLPPMWAALVPVVIVESFIVHRVVRASLGRTLGALAAANIASTIVGVPIVWFVLAIGEMLCCGGALGLSTPLTRVYAVTVQAPWLIPYESDLGWMIPAALLTLGIVFAALSVLIETPITSRILRIPSRTMWRRMAWANVSSYLLLGALAWALVNSGANLDALYKPFEPLLNGLVDGIFRISSWLPK
jgi:hypothetical protein